MDFNKIAEQAANMQKDIERVTKELEAAEFEGTASNGLVKVVMNGQYVVKSVDIDKSILNPDDKEMIDDLLLVAINDSLNKIKETSQNKINSITQGYSLPGM